MAQPAGEEDGAAARDAWRRLCRVARTRISPALFRACFAGTYGIMLRDDVLTVAAPNATVCEQLNRRFATLLADLSPRVLRHAITLCFILHVALPVTANKSKATNANGDSNGKHIASNTSKDANSYRRQQRQHVTALPSPLSDVSNVLTLSAPAVTPMPLLKPHYTFAEFIVGDSNRFAYAAAQSVADEPGQNYNPLFIYGGVGLGKTHLLMAIGHAVVAKGLRVGYVTSETFTNEIVDAIQQNTQEQFRARYREMDVLLVDDIQFIGGKERTEEEFFHTFNALHNANKQIVVTSDRPPRAIPTLHDRLRSRFEWGLLADIALPDFADRLAIAQAKVAALDVTIPRAALEYLARPEGVSVRVLEGALNHVTAAARLNGGKVTMSLVAATLRECFGEHGRLELSPAAVLDIVTNHYRVPTDDLIGKGRSRNLAWPRQVTMYLLREETAASLAQIGAALGGRDHTTIMHGCEHVADSIRRDESVHREIETLRNALRVM